MRVVILWAGLCLAGVHAAAGAQTAVALPQVLELVGQQPEVALARRAADAAAADVLAADRAPTPVLSAKAASLDLDNGLGAGSVLGRKRIDKGVGLDWTFERGDKRTLRAATARHQAEAAHLDAAEVVVQQQLAAAAGFFDLLSAQQRQLQLQALAEHAAELAAAALRRQRAGDASQQELLRTEVEARRAAAEVRAAQAEVEKSGAALAQLTGLALPLRAVGDWPDVRQTRSAATDPEQRADVRAASRRVEAAESALRSALALRRNDVTVGASLDHYPGTSRRLAEVRMQMPLAGWFGNYAYEGEIGRARAELSQAEVQLEKVRRAAATENARLTAELAAASDRAGEYAQAIVPRARQTADMAELAYRRGAVPLSDLIEARRTLRAVLMDEIAVRAEHARAQAAWQVRHAIP